ncbi:MAG: hypothetical protein LBR79_00885 [Oscillospiraceae bacterium]|nr:hypothetical protein [Oscillospiraceae bacterium]
MVFAIVKNETFLKGVSYILISTGNVSLCLRRGRYFKHIFDFLIQDAV